ncbi:MAG: TatD family hydrolase [Verrucomicrobium sp.]|nr:TatD family hydrolase [Verrucomicrobium sp.]
MILETHAHLYYPDFDADRGEVVARAREQGVTEIIAIGTGLESSRKCVALTREYPGVLWATVGIHPCDVGPGSLAELEEIRPLLAQSGVVAVGEIGLDYHRLPEDPAQVAAIKRLQAEAFRAQLEMAAQAKLNVVIHQRDSWDDTLAILKEFTGRLRGVYHCFGGTTAQAEELFALGHLVSFTGIVTFKNGKGVLETAAKIPLDKFMVETDCPYLAPVPHRGQRCEPAHTRLIAQTIADARGLSLADLGAATTATARGFFRFPEK